MSSCVINEQKLCEDIFSKFVEISGFNEVEESEDYYKKREKEIEKRRAIFFWKTNELKKLMSLLENKNNSVIVSHAIIFILSLEKDEELSGMNASHLNNSARREFKMVLRSEFSEDILN